MQGQLLFIVFNNDMMNTRVQAFIEIGDFLWKSKLQETLFLLKRGAFAR